ncbi:MAG: hypothetical protein ACR2G5_12275 [Pyrinomonadaceae bacterium]
MNEDVQVYSCRHQYKSDTAITIPVTIASGRLASIDLLGKLDTGSTFCIVERAYARLLGLDLESGHRQRFETATGAFLAFGHEITLSIFDYEWDTVVYFADPESFGLNVLGRIGFLDHLRLGVVDYEQLLYCGLYDGESSV